MKCNRILHAASLVIAMVAPNLRAADVVAGGPGAEGGIAILTKKALCVPLEGQQVVNNAVILVRDGKIEAVGPSRSTPIPAGYEVLDVGDRWVMPGMVDLHCHIAGTFDINDMVYLTNPGLRASTSVVPDNAALRRGVAGGVTSVLFIPGSGTNIGGQGVLLKTALPTFEEMRIKDPGSMKLAQAGNPERFMGGVARSFMNYNTRNTFRRGVAYAKRWEAYERGEGERPEKDLQFEVFRALMKDQIRVSTHTQIYQVVNMTIQMIAKEMGVPVFIDHGTFDGWRAADLAQEAGVNAILGPRSIDVPTYRFIRWSGSNPERIQGVAAGYQSMGHKMIGFNTDSPVIPQEELQLQAGVGVRYGFDDSNLEAVRGLTIVPATTSRIGHRVGSIEVGKDADLLIITGHPADPRSSVETVFIEGRKVYDPAVQTRRW
jgi:imidazolonepropionase-like amidohydrolase